MFSRIFIERPRFAMVISIVLTLAGAISVFSLPISLYPQVTPPTITVSATYPGASAEVIANTVGIPLEEAINGVEDMLYMDSTSDSAGSYQLTVTFKVGVDPDLSQVKTQNRVQQALSKLPADVQQQGVTVSRRSTDILGFLSARSPKGTMDALQLSDYVQNNIKNNLIRVNGVGEANVYAPPLSMRVWLDADKITALNLPISSIASAIQGQNVQPSLGKVGAMPGDGVLVPDPGYPTYTSASEIAGAKIHRYDLLPENGWQPDFDALEKMDLEGVKLMWVNYPNMPTGAKATPELFRKITDFGLRHNIVIAHDNPYSFILNDKPLSILSTPGAKEIAIEMNSLSKSHNMPGWRVAMLASNPQFVEYVVKVKSNVDSGQFRPVMEAAAKALLLPDKWHEHVNAIYRPRRRIAEEIMRALDCSFDPSQSGLFLWGSIPDCYKDAGELADKLLYEGRVFLTPGFIFGKNGERYIRISLCAKEPRMLEALQRVKNLKLNDNA